MKSKLLIVFCVGLISLSMNLVYAVPPPCSQEELLETSDYAIEGYVVNMECGEPYDSGECRPISEGKCASVDEEGNKIEVPCPRPEYKFKPELVSDCIATVKVTKNLKGDYNIGNEVKISFLKLVQECEDECPCGPVFIVPGSPKKNFRLDSKIRYYNSRSCTYWNLEEIEEPTPEPPKGCLLEYSPSSDKEIEKGTEIEVVCKAWNCGGLGGAIEARVFDAKTGETLAANWENRDMGNKSCVVTRKRITVNHDLFLGFQASHWDYEYADWIRDETKYVTIKPKPTPTPTPTVTPTPTKSSSDWIAIRVSILDFGYEMPFSFLGRPPGELYKRWFMNAYVTNEEGVKIAEARSPIHWLSDESECWIDLVIRKDIPEKGDSVIINLEAFTWLTGNYIDINSKEPNLWDMWGRLPYDPRGRRLTIPYIVGTEKDDWGIGGTGLFSVKIDFDGKLHYQIETLEPSDWNAIRVNILDFDYTMPTGGIPGPVCSRWFMNGYVTNEESVKIAERRSPVHQLSDESKCWVDLVIRKDIPERGDKVSVTLEPRTYALLNCIDINASEITVLEDLEPPPGFPPWPSPLFQAPFGPFNPEGRSYTTSYTVGFEKGNWTKGKDSFQCPMDLDGELHYKIETLDPSDWIAIRVNIIDFDYEMPSSVRRPGPLYKRWYMNGYVTNEEGVTIAGARSPLFWLSEDYFELHPRSECWVDLVFRKDIPERGDSVSITLEPRTWATGNYIDINASEPEPVPFPTYNPKGRRLTIPYIVGDEKEDWGIGEEGVLIDFDGKLHYKIETIGLSNSCIISSSISFEEEKMKRQGRIYGDVDGV